MPNPEQTKKQIDDLTADLIESGLSSRQHFAVRKDHAGEIVEITTEKYQDTAIFLKNISYSSLYKEVMERELFNILMVDGAVLQLQYLFKAGIIQRHRLAFFPSPSLEEFQNNYEVYETDEIYADIIMKSIYPAPLRFDFDREAAVDIDHPMSHLTLGQYSNCRIPVASPLSPFIFIQFILKSFYNVGFKKYCSNLKQFSERFDHTMTDNEVKMVHMRIPS